MSFTLQLSISEATNSSQAPAPWVLIVEDEKEYRDVLAEKLTQEGYVVL